MGQGRAGSGAALPGSRSTAAPTAPGRLRIRGLARRDLTDILRIDAYHTGTRKPGYWKRVLGEFLGGSERHQRVGLAAHGPRGLSGYLLGEVRAFEFGSEPCGWIFAVGVDPGAMRQGVATALVDEACRRFRAAGVSTVRTMVRRNDVPVLTFFRASGFSGGPYVQLELDVGPQR